MSDCEHFVNALTELPVSDFKFRLRTTNMDGVQYASFLRLPQPTRSDNRRVTLGGCLRKFQRHCHPLEWRGSLLFLPISWVSLECDYKYDRSAITTVKIDRLSSVRRVR